MKYGAKPDTFTNAISLVQIVLLYFKLIQNAVHFLLTFLFYFKPSYQAFCNSFISSQIN